MGCDQSKYAKNNNENEEKQAVIVTQEQNIPIEKIIDPQPEKVQPKEEIVMESSCPFGFGKKPKKVQEQQETIKEQVQEQQEIKQEQIQEKQVEQQDFNHWKDCKLMEYKKCGYINRRIKEYEDLPIQITEWKFKNILDEYTIYQRLQLLGLFSVAVGISSRKALKSSLLITSRNMVLSFYGLGLMLAPEIYNEKIFAFQ